MGLDKEKCKVLDCADCQYYGSEICNRSIVGKRKIVIYCPICEHQEPFDIIYCRKCGAIVRRCVDCAYYDIQKKFCDARNEAIALNDAENPTRHSLSVRCEGIRPLVR